MKPLAGVIPALLLFAGILPGTTRPASPRDLKTLVISGEFGFIGQGGELYEQSTTVTFSPALSILVAPGLAVGAVLDISATGIRDYGSSTTLAFGPRLTWLMPSLTRTDRIPGSVYPFIGGGIRFISDSATNGFHYAATGTRIPLEAGLLVMVSQSTGLFFRSFYHLDYLLDEDTGEGSVGNRYGLTVGLGLFRYR